MPAVAAVVASVAGEDGSGGAVGFLGRDKRLFRFPLAPRAAPDPLVCCWGPDRDPIERPCAIPDTPPRGRPRTPALAAAAAAVVDDDDDSAAPSAFSAVGFLFMEAEAGDNPARKRPFW